MAGSWVKESGSGLWEIGNDVFKLVVAMDAEGFPTLEETFLTIPGRTIAWKGSGRIVPTIVMRDAGGRESIVSMSCRGVDVVRAMDVRGRGRKMTKAPVLQIRFAREDGLEMTHHLCPSGRFPVFRSWTVVRNTTTAPVTGMARFDAMNLRLVHGKAEPQAACVLGWLPGLRADAPARPPVLFDYPMWIPRFLYGDPAPSLPPPPEGGWTAVSLRLVRERLTKLPLRSGKRSTYDNYPWVTVWDPDGRGFFAGFEWSGQWRADVERHVDRREVSLFFSTDGNIHTLDAGASLESPAAFLGLFHGDWDDGFNACRRWVREEILPQAPAGFPDAHYDIMAVGRYANRDRDTWKREVDAAAAVGIDSFMVDAGWWKEGMRPGEDFSPGLGFFEEDPAKFPDGLRGISDYVRSKGMKFGLWFEFERVDVRTANRGRNPWKPEWMLHQKGYPYRSWLQHVFLLCLGSHDAAEWARENIVSALERYGVDWLKIDGNEYAFCDDVSHGHGKEDGDWNQTLGLYHVMDGIMEAFPDLIIENCAGGSQRADFGMARFSHVLQTNDICNPSAIVRQYSHGVGCMYPTSYGMMHLPPYPESGLFTGQEMPDGVGCSPQRLEWRCLCRMMGTFDPNLEYWRMGEAHLQVMRRVIATYKKVIPTLHGDRYVLAGPPQLVAPSSTEAGQWEAYEHLSVDDSAVSVFFYRCLSPDAEFRVRLRGLDPAARYRGESHTGGNNGEWTGAELAQSGLACRLDRTMSAEVVLLGRLP